MQKKSYFLIASNQETIRGSKQAKQNLFPVGAIFSLLLRDYIIIGMLSTQIGCKLHWQTNSTLTRGL